MRYVWDPAKDLLNKRKHGLSLEDGIAALEDPGRDFWFDDRFDYGEERIVTMGRGKRSLLVVVSTEVVSLAEGDEIIRIISVREANKREYHKFYFG
ncbi:MAG: BrnT family toxin [Terracidiphilus sp.]|jgi:uncharacterized DUF497 family protein